MKIIKLLLCIFVLSTITASANIVRLTQIWCENTHTHTNALFVFDDNGRLLSGTGIDCFGNMWSKDYGIYTGATSGGDPSVWIGHLSPSMVRVSANKAVDLQVVDLSNGSTVIGDIYHLVVTGDDGTVSIDISTLPVATYGILVTKDGGALNMLTFDKR